MNRKGGRRFVGILVLWAVMTVALPLVCGAAMRLLQPPQTTPPFGGEAPPAAQATPEQSLGQQTAVPAQVVRLWDAGQQRMMTLTLHEYLLGAVASEMPQSYDDEALKAQIVATHSYYEYCRQNGSFDLEGDAVLQVDTLRREGYITPETRAAVWGDWTETNTQRMERLLAEVGGLVLCYDGAPAAACYHATSAGRTAAAEDIWGEAVPYLISVDSAWDEDVDGFEQVVSFTYQQMYDVLSARFVGPDLSGKPATWFGAVQATDEGYVTQLRVGGAWLSGADVRSWLGLRSTCMTVEIQDGVFVVTTRGYGHGVGMSQTGAAAMAAAGSDYAAILQHYYPGTVLTAV